MFHCAGYYCFGVKINKVSENKNDCGLRLDSNSFLLGDDNSFNAENISRDVWLSAAEWGGKLYSKITKGTKLERDSQATILATSNRLGIYSQNGMDITSLGDKGLVITANNLSLKTNNGIVAQGRIECNNTITANGFNFGENKQAANSSAGANENLVSADIWEHIDNLYRLVKQASDK